ncbi:MAG: sigma-54-dependent Fis family transcriptional regulator [Proteobacteria bacterium]|nr:sigma-54-dependent Fis family transcriptional regulator [Pseudomonadota bacterium]
MIDENEFYRQATRRICGSLEFENALLESARFLRKEIPVDKMFLQFFDVGLKAMHTVAIATPEKGLAVDLLVPFSPEALQEMGQFEKEFLQQKKNYVWLFQDRLYDQLLNQEYFGFHKTKITSLIVMPLGLGDKVVGAGSIYLITEGDQKFDERHAELVSMLKEPFAIAMSNALRYREVVRLKERLADDNQFLHRELLHISGDEIIGADYGLREVMQQVRQVAPTNSPVLLSGETGVGKDVVANAIHLSSSRSDGPFIPVNCGAIPESLLDSELFGHEKGAFTGALSKKRGRFERADKGTILLDEIGEMPLEAQVRLLRVLQSREIERVGGTKTISLDIRIIAATNKDLEREVKEGRFREDLWFRLNVFPIIVPPLRERSSDIPAFVQHFIERKAKELKVGDPPRLAKGAIDILMAYDWPGNVRELENIVERAMILHRGEPLKFDELGSAPPQRAAENQQSLELDAMTVQHITRVLDITDGKIHGPGGAGELLGVNPNTLRYKMKKLGISFRKNQ